MTTQQCHVKTCERQVLAGKGYGYYCDVHKFLQNMYQTEQSNTQLALAADTNELLRELISKVDELITEIAMQRIRQMT